jgi:hypothetical protein
MFEDSSLDHDIENMSDDEFEKIYGISKEIAKYEGMTREEFEDLLS